jgi:eukaryotic-like serine/threonine-protein kinase
VQLTSSTIIDGKYQVVRQLGEGGMGAVYEARHRGTGRRVAVKVIAGAMLARNPEVVSRFQREALASGAIESQYIAQILDTGVDPTMGTPYTVMELLVGEDLQQAMQRLGPLPPDLAMRIAAQAAMGLRKAHESSVVHRDIKPANLFLARREEGDVLVKLLDFGIAKVRADQPTVAESGGLTRTGAMLGSPLYMSPEQARGKRDIDHRTDVWSLGVVLYEALAGTTPHGHIESIGELILQICSTTPRHVQELAPWVPPDVAGIVHRALALDPAQRFQTAAEMADALRALLPGSTALSESMFVAMTDQARAAAAPKLALTSGMRAPSPSLVSSTTIGVDTSGAAGSATNVAARTKNRTLVLVPVALVMAGIGVAAAWRVASSRRAPAAEGSAAASMAMSAAASVPSSSGPGAASTTAVALVPLDRTVRLVVLPAAASAQVDGADAPVQDGAVAVTGALGSVHHVRLTSGRTDQTFEIAIADDGPVPPKIELLLPRPAVGGGTPTRPPPPQPTTTSTSSMHMDLK